MLWVLFVLGLLVRLSVLFLDYSFDVNNHIVWAKDVIERGLQNFYETQSSEVYAVHYPNYPPLAIFLFTALYPLQSLVFKFIWWINLHVPLFPSPLVFFTESRMFLAGLMKLPAIAADIGITWLTIAYARKLIPKDHRFHAIAASLILFNPAFFYNSAYWGQIDVIPLFFTLLSFYFLSFTQRYLLSSLFLIVAFLVKPTVLVFLPIYTIFFIKKFKLLQSLKVLLLSQVIFLLAFIPFNGTGWNIFTPYLIYFRNILEAQSLPFVTNGALNAWIFITGFEGIRDTAIFFNGLSYRMVGYLLTALFFTVIVYFFTRKKDTKTALMYAAGLCALAGFLFLTKMHERYLLLPLPFLLLATFKDRRILPWFLVLSVTSFLNLYHSWPVPRINLLFSSLQYSFIYSSLALINVVVFVVCLLRLSTFSLSSKNKVNDLLEE